jgi:protein-S-isoprenylcysteine O-methyltransferase Ste14
MFVTKLIILAVASSFFVVVSVLRPSRHGVFRLLAWESLLVLILLNADNWFQDPFSPLQVCSWVLLIASMCLAVEGIRLLRKIGKPKDELEDTTVLVVVGAYHYIRHPLYASLLFLGWGAFLKGPSPLAGALVVAASAFLVATAKVEEKRNLEKFGNDYVDYMKRTRMFIPFLL